MRSLLWVSCVFAPGVGIFCAGAAFGQNYPVKPIRIVTAEPGGGNDFAARVLAQGLTRSLGQPVIVENRGGAGGAIAAETAEKAPPDGYTLLLYAGNIWTIPLLRSNVQYDAIRDFSPITWVARSPNTVVVHPSLPVRSVKELIALAKARPGQLNYASGGSGSATHLSVELFKAMAGVNIVRVPYKGNAPALNDLIAGQVQLMFVTAATGAPHFASGRLRALAVTSAEPSILAPGLPTVASSGLPGYESISIYGFFAPSKTPASIIRLLNQESAQYLKTADVRERFFKVGVETVGSTPEEFAAAIKSDMAKMAKVIKDAGIREE
jgi:tripartite-type tricarboxylate transporter receptor subunit TctC